MTWDPPGLWASLILSIFGGILAGALILVGEFLARREFNFRQQSKAAKAVGLFFGEWEKAVNNAPAIPAQGGAPAAPVHAVQFAFHKNYLGRAPNHIARWSRHLTAEQLEELSNLLEGHQRAAIGILPPSTVLAQAQYNQFFSQARQIKWLEF